MTTKKRFGGNLTYGVEAIRRQAIMIGCELIPEKLAQGLAKIAPYYDIKKAL